MRRVNSTYDSSGDSEAVPMPVPGEFDNNEAVSTLEKVATSKRSTPRAHMIVIRPVPGATGTSESSSPGPSAAEPPPV